MALLRNLLLLACLGASLWFSLRKPTDWQGWGLCWVCYAGLCAWGWVASDYERRKLQAECDRLKKERHDSC